MNSEYMMDRLDRMPETTDPWWCEKNMDELRQMRERGGFRTKETKVKNRSWNERKRRAKV